MRPPFHQEPPELGNQDEDDRVLRSYLRRVLPTDVRAAIEPELTEMGALAGGELYRQELAERLDEPRLVSWDAWEKRIDRIEPTGLRKRAERLAAERGLAVELPGSDEASALDLALDALRAVANDPETSVALRTQVATRIAGLRDPSLVSAGRRAEEAIAHALDVLASDASPTILEAGARRWALTVGRAYSLALLARPAQCSLDHAGDLRARAAAHRFAATLFDLSSAFTAEDSAMLANERIFPPSEEVVVADARE